MATRRHLPLPRRWTHSLVAVALISLVAVAQPAGALPGPDPGDAGEEFSVDLRKASADIVPFDSIAFTRSTGWDFGDRESYRCAYVERFDAQGNLLFKVEFERSNEYSPGTLINDRNGMESGEGGAPPSNGDQCGSSSGDGAWQPSGEDHFPHHTHQHLYVDGVELTAGYVDLHRDDCSHAYWTPGDEPGEAILWWDEDGPQHTHPGGPMLPCNGGDQEPSAVARMMVIPVAANTGVCTHDELAGSRCTGLTAPQPPAPGDQSGNVGLRLRGHLRAFGFVNAPGSEGVCLGARTVRVERRQSGHWHTAATDLTSATGFYSVRLGDRAGTYRTRVVGTTLATGEVCETAVSRKRDHGH